MRSPRTARGILLAAVAIVVACVGTAGCGDESSKRSRSGSATAPKPDPTTDDARIRRAIKRATAARRGEDRPRSVIATLPRHGSVWSSPPRAAVITVRGPIDRQRSRIMQLPTVARGTTLSTPLAAPERAGRQKIEYTICRPQKPGRRDGEDCDSGSLTWTYQPGPIDRRYRRASTVGRPIRIRLVSGIPSTGWIAVRRGATVSWINEGPGPAAVRFGAWDPTFRRKRAMVGPARGDDIVGSAPIAPGNAWTYRFTTPGEYRYHNPWTFPAGQSRLLVQ